jgi:hypothetical protein
MTLKQVKNHLTKVKALEFQFPEGSIVPAHFDVIEVGQVTKDFVNCRGTLRHEKAINFQLWNTEDIDHRLQPKKLKNSIQLSENKLFLGDKLDAEVEYQDDTVGKYHLGFTDVKFQLMSMLMDCSAKDKCGIVEPKSMEKSSVCSS